MLPGEIISGMKQLVKPSSDCKSLEEAFEKALETCRIDCNNLVTLEQIHKTIPELSLEGSWWNFTRVLLHELLLLKCSFEKGTEMENLLSVEQQQTVRKCVEMLVSIGILPHLTRGIGVPIERRSSSFNMLKIQINTEQKAYCVGYIIRGLLVLYEEENLCKVITNHHLGDVLAGLFHILLLDKSTQVLAMQRDYYKEKLAFLVENAFQPLVIRELMILNANKECPPRLLRALRGILSERLTVEGGVAATINAILEIAGDPHSPKQWQTVATLAKLIVTPHTKNIPEYYEKISSQVIPLLRNSEPQFMQIAVTCVRHLEEKDSKLCSEYFLGRLLKPLMEPTGEEEMTGCMEALYNCFALPGSDQWAVPVRLLGPVGKSLFRLYFSVYRGISYLKLKIEELFWCFLSSVAGENEMCHLFEEFVFYTEEALDEPEEELYFGYGEGGGVVSVLKKHLLSSEELSDCLLELILKRDSNGIVKTRMFTALLSLISELDLRLDKRLISAKLLSVLASETEVHNTISEDPSSIIHFLQVLLGRRIIESTSYDEEIICLGLMVLSIILSDTTKERDWQIFTPLVQPLRQLKDESTNPELKVLSEEIYCLILTHGVVDKTLLNPELKMKKEIPKGEIVTECDRAIKEACDPLLPVRAHALRELAKLMLKGDKQTKAKKETIYCIFKENLKDEDSFLYLSAIEGMASMATVYADQVLLTITEQYVDCKEPELRLKVGEVLIRIVRNLGEMVYKYKAELLNAFLFGCRDSDHIVRASSLSNLGEMCKILSFRIGIFAVEIFECLQSIMETDKAPEPRRAAVMVLTLIIKGLGADALQVLEPILLQLYRKLKYLYQVEKDDITKLHAQLALEELNSCTNTYLFPPQTFQKRIFVLDPPS